MVKQVLNVALGLMVAFSLSANAQVKQAAKASEQLSAQLLKELNIGRNFAKNLNLDIGNDKAVTTFLRGNSTEAQAMKDITAQVAKLMNEGKSMEAAANIAFNNNVTAAKVFAKASSATAGIQQTGLLTGVKNNVSANKASDGGTCAVPDANLNGASYCATETGVDGQKVLKGFVTGLIGSIAQQGSQLAQNVLGHVSKLSANVKGGLSDREAAAKLLGCKSIVSDACDYFKSNQVQAAACAAL